MTALDRRAFQKAFWSKPSVIFFSVQLWWLGELLS